jgi:hypothetical protein
MLMIVNVVICCVTNIMEVVHDLGTEYQVPLSIWPAAISSAEQLPFTITLDFSDGAIVSIIFC